MSNLSYLDQSSEDYTRIRNAIEFIVRNRLRQPGLNEIAESVHLSKYHFQRIFTRWAGISPKRFMQFLTVQHAKQVLDQSKSTLETAFETGLSSTSRLHDLFVAAEAITPGAYKNRGAGLTIVYGFHASPLGPCLLSVTDKGICWLSFADNNYRDSALNDLYIMFPGASFRSDRTVTQPFMEKIFPPDHRMPGERFNLYVTGTNFQIKVWQALLTIPPGAALTYADIARFIGHPGAARAVGNAVASNPVSYLIPCHRVIRKSGIIGNYRWGTIRKRALLARESALCLYEDR